MRKTDQQRQIEALYDDDIRTLLVRKYEDEGYSQHELADELDVNRTTLQYWLREHGVEIRSRALSDVQRITVMALLPYLSNSRIADRVNCSYQTVKRYRREIRQTGSPVEVSCDLTRQDRAVLIPDHHEEWADEDTNAAAGTVAARESKRALEPTETATPALTQVTLADGGWVEREDSSE